MSKNSRLIALNACLGNLFEHYDTALFSLLSPFLATQFFPNHNPLTALILTYAIIPLGIIIRPIGSLVFGYVGDVYGRKSALFISLIGMALVSILMGLLPTYNHVGVLAPIFLSIGKLFQNFFGAGEVVGGAIYLIENTEKKHQNIMSGIYSSSTIAGILLASAGVALLSTFDLIDNGWRFLYFFGCLTACFGCIIRFKVGYAEPEVTPKKEFLKNVFQSIWKMRIVFFMIAIASGFSYATYSMAFIMINGLIPFVSEMTYTQVMHLNTVLLIVDLLLLPFFGLLANRFSIEKLMLSSALVAMLGGIPLFLLLEQATFFMIIFVRLCLVIIGVWFSATFYSWSQQLVPQAMRYTIISLAYAIGSQLFGAPTSVISLWCYQQTGMISSVCWYWVFLGTIFSFVFFKQYVKTTSNVRPLGSTII
ncbi:MAG: MFS transporter [Parachlamydiaceae bacterium]|nr:MFS transporter [Parachlamydiaceae bacterium]